MAPRALRVPETSAQREDECLGERKSWLRVDEAEAVRYGMNIHPVDTQSLNATDKRDRILDAALSAFAERGFHGTPVPLIAERAQVGAGTIYRYFESKEALVNALYRRSKLAFLDEVSAGFPADRPPAVEPYLSVRDRFRHQQSGSVRLSGDAPSRAVPR